VEEICVKLKRWAWLVVGLYCLLLVLLVVPLVMLCWVKWSAGPPAGLKFEIGLPEILDGYKEWGFWAWLGVLVAAQALLLLVPLDLRGRRLTPRVSILVPMGTAAFLLANLFFAGLLCLSVAVFGDKALDAIGTLGSFVVKNPASTRVFTVAGVTSNTFGDTFTFMMGFFQLLGVFWLIWAFIFYRAAKRDAPDSLVQRTTRWLLRGSILELLIAVPSHVIVRNRSECCAPVGTFWGIVTGLAVMGIAFGPGVFFLFVDRVERLKPKAPQPEPEPVQPAG
jgi:hypothetical protein